VHSWRRNAKITSKLQHKTTQIEEYERMLQLVQKEKAELLERKDRITKKFCDEALTTMCAGIKRMDDRYAVVTTLVDKPRQKGN
jgi:hypothetical protein